MRGLGGIDYLSGYWSWNDYWWGGTNGDFGTWAANDGGSNSGAIEVRVDLTAGQKTRVVLTWINRGTYMYAHKNDVAAIGTDLDLRVFNPSGSQVDQSISV